MAIEYSGYIEVNKGQSHGGGTVRIPFNFQSAGILTQEERQQRARELYDNFRALVTDYDESRQGQYLDIVRIRYQSVTDIGFQRWEDPHAGLPAPVPHVGR